MHKREAHALAIVGCGTVGGSTAKLLIDDREARGLRTAVDVYVKYIIDTNFEHAEHLNLPGELFESDAKTALNDPEVKTVIELVGGTGFAKEIIIQCLRAGKHVITANKALLAHHGQELYGIAREHRVCLAFEASCGGGIPIIRALTDGLVANKIGAIFGIVNGTCNYILTEMSIKGRPYQEMLSQAQSTGLAEANPSLDVNGSDSAHKIAIMAGLAFGEAISFDQIPITGIDSVQTTDINLGSELGYVLKLIAWAVKSSHGTLLRVAPAFITWHHPLARVDGPFNAISVYGDSLGHSMYYGRGAGGSPTASAVVADAISIANGSYLQIFNSLQTWPDLCPAANQLKPEETEGHYYIRLQLEDSPGMIARVSEILTHYNISVHSIIQHGTPEDVQSTSNTSTSLVITTHRVMETTVKQAVTAILTLKGVFNEHRVIPILDEYPEFLSP